jgi:hypothetical protein
MRNESENVTEELSGLKRYGLTCGNSRNNPISKIANPRTMPIRIKAANSRFPSSVIHLELKASANGIAVIAYESRATSNHCGKAEKTFVAGVEKKKMMMRCIGKK